MRLDTHENVIRDVAELDVARIVSSLTASGAAYLVLSDYADQETYLQAAGTIQEGFIVERRDGCAGEHYRGDRRIFAAERTTMLVNYLRGEVSWSFVLSWHRILVGGDDVED